VLGKEVERIYMGAGLKLNSFKLFGLKRKLDIFCPVEDFFELHSIVTEGEKDKKWVKKGNFLAN